jgi:5'(3')-deoxyribonucleotidase
MNVYITNDLGPHSLLNIFEYVVVSSLFCLHSPRDGLIHKDVLISAHALCFGKFNELIVLFQTSTNVHKQTFVTLKQHVLIH